MRRKMVLETRPTHAGQGTAIDRLPETSPLIGRPPIFMGDDITDEDWFAAVNRYGGISINVGTGETQAAYRVSDVTALCG